MFSMNHISNNWYGPVCGSNRSVKTLFVFDKYVDKKNSEETSHRMFVCLFEFYSISTFVGYLMPNPLLYNKQFYFKQFSLA